SGQAEAAININDDVIGQLQATIASICARIPECAPPNPLEILRWPGVMVEREQDTKIIEEKTLTLFSATLASFMQQREREGQQLKLLIEERLDAITQIVTGIRSSLPEIL